MVEQAGDSRLNEVAWTWSRVDGLSNPWPESGGFPENTTIGAAVEAAILGHRNFARTLLQGTMAAGEGLDSGWIGVPANDSVTPSTAFLIATHYVNQILQPNSDRREIRDKLASIDQLGLVKKSQRTLARGLKDVLTDLDATLKLSTAQPGSADAAVDNLIDVIGYDSSGQLPDKEYKRVLSFGLAAVPALARDLDGRKITRSFSPRIMNSVPHIEPVSWVAHELLLTIAKGELGRDGQMLTSRQVLAWYRAKTAGKSEQYLLENVIEEIPGKRETIRIPNTRTFDAIAESHPHLFRRAFQRLLAAKPPVDTYLAVWSVEKAKLTAAEKTDIILLGAHSANLGQRSGSMWMLHKFDRKALDKILIQTLRSPPAGFNDDFESFAMLATGTSNPKVWKALEWSLHHVTVATRLMMVSRLKGGYTALEPDNKYDYKALPILKRLFDDNQRPAGTNGNRMLSQFLIDRNTRMCSVSEVAIQTAGDILGILNFDGFERPPSQWPVVKKQVLAKLRERDISFSGG